MIWTRLIIYHRWCVATACLAIFAWVTRTCLQTAILKSLFLWPTCERITQTGPRTTFCNSVATHSVFMRATWRFPGIFPPRNPAVCRVGGIRASSNKPTGAIQVVQCGGSNSCLWCSGTVQNHHNCIGFRRYFDGGSHLSLRNVAMNSDDGNQWIFSTGILARHLNVHGPPGTRNSSSSSWLNHNSVPPLFRVPFDTLGKGPSSLFHHIPAQNQSIWWEVTIRFIKQMICNITWSISRNVP